MAVNLPNFLNAAIVSQKPTGLENLFENIAKGYQMGRIPAQTRMNEQSKMLANALAEIQAQYAPMEAEADIGYKTANAERLSALSQLPFGGKSLPGPAGEMLSIAMLDAQYPEIAAQARKAMELKNKDTESRIETRNTLNQSASRRYSPPTTRLRNDLADAKAGYRPGTFRKEKLDQDEVEGTVRSIKAELEKKTSPAGSQKIAGDATILNKEIQQIDITPLLKYAGVAGRSRLGFETIKGQLTGKPNKDLQDYNHYKQSTSKVIGDMIRKGLITSIAPRYISLMIMPLVDPTASVWNNPHDVQRRIDGLKAWAEDYEASRLNQMKYGIEGSMEYENSKEGKYEDEMERLMSLPEGDLMNLSDAELELLANGG